MGSRLEQPGFPWMQIRVRASQKVQIKEEVLATSHHRRASALQTLGPIKCDPRFLQPTISRGETSSQWTNHSLRK